MHVSTDETPYFICTGRDIRLPYNTLTENDQINYNDWPTYCENFIPELRRVFKETKLKLESAAEKQELYRKKSAVDKKITVGNLVMLHTPAIKQGLCKKFTKFNRGPFRVLREISNVNLEIQEIENPDRIQTVHVDRLIKIEPKPTFPLWENYQDEIQNNSKSTSPQSSVFRKENDLFTLYARKRKGWARRNLFQGQGVKVEGQYPPLVSSLESNQTEESKDTPVSTNEKKRGKRIILRENTVTHTYSLRSNRNGR